MFHSKRAFVLLATIFCLAGPRSLAQPVPEQLIDFTATGARIFAASRGQTLTPSSASPAAAVAAFQRSQGRPQATLNSMVLTSQSANARTGLTHLRFQQVVNGLTVYGAYVKATVNSRIELMHLVEVLPDPAAQIPGSNVSALAALQAAAAALYSGRTFNFQQAGQVGNTIQFSAGDSFFYRNPTATRVILPLSGGAMQVGWLVETWTGAGNQLHHTVVGSGGRILLSEPRTANENYKVFAEHPPIVLGGSSIGAPQTTVSGPSSTAESPNGWISSDGRTGGAQSLYRLSGNNVYAYLDRDSNNSPDPGGTTITDGNFTATANLTQEPTVAVNQQVAIQNLFWANNIIHDKLHRHGFNEAAGNFQQNNFGRGGAGNDSVNAEAQDGGGTNNANFATPNDGSSPRMQMYLWNQSNPNRDGDVDTDIVYHEYGHGLTSRMIGSMSGCMSGAIGEGASDVLSILMNADDVVAEYSYNSSLGIRRYRYQNYPLTYNDLSGSSVHANGELFAAILWRAKEYFEQNSISLDYLWDYFVDGMNYTPAGPRYEDMRNGMVQSAVNRGLGHQCHIWRAFADFGVGVGASGSCSGFIFVRWNVSESFNRPAECLGNTAPTVNIASPAEGATVSGSSVPISISASDAQDAVGTLNVQWNVDGGPWQTATYNAMTQRYEANWNSASVGDGGHTINAQATDSGSLVGANSNSVTVNNVNDPPVAAFAYTCSGLTCNFNASISSDPDNNIANYSWNFGDGSSASGVTASRTYAAPGTYTVTLLVTDSGGLSDDEVKSVTVNAESPAPTISSISPTSMQRGTSGAMTISGANFVSGASVTFVDGNGPTPTASGVTGSGTTLTCTVTVPGGGPARDRVWSVRVTNPDGKSATLTGGFTVKP